MTAPRPLSAEITAALRRLQEALHVEYGLADKKCPTADEYYFAGKSCVDARAELDSLLLADPAPKPASKKLRLENPYAHWGKAKPARSVHDRKWDDAEALRKGRPRKEQKK